MNVKFLASNGTMASLWVLLMISLVQHSVQQTNWCQLKCANGKEHTMCKYSVPQDKNDCKDMKDSMTDDAKKRILGLHNYARNHIAAGNVKGWPGAANMRQMSWDDDCAQVALRWGFQCTPGHDECRRTDKFPSVGQNWGEVSDQSGYPDAAFKVFKLWLDEIGLASAKIVDKYKFKYEYAHFTALVWAQTYKIGCGLINCTTQTGGNTFFRSILTCNYAPAGNVRQKPMWEKGDPCKNCPSGTQCNAKSSYRNLCASPDDPADEAPVPVDINTSGPHKFEFISFILLSFSGILTTSAMN